MTLTNTLENLKWVLFNR